MTTDVARVLRAARERIATPERWTQGEYARTDKGDALPADDILSRRASCWCAVGALRAAGVWSDDGNQFTRALADAIGLLDDYCIPDWNDTPGRTHAEVLDAFSKAIELAESAP